jgi:hypothetical protein
MDFMRVIYFEDDLKLSLQFYSNMDPVLCDGTVLNLAASGTFRISLMSPYSKCNDTPSVTTGKGHDVIISS